MMAKQYHREAMNVLRATMFKLSLLISLCFVLSASAKAQGYMALPPMEAGGGYTGPVPPFDVVSVKPHKGGDDMMMMHVGQSDYKTVNLTLKSLIAGVYDVKVWLVFGLPSWAESMHWDIDAKVSAPDVSIMKKLTPEQRREMIAGILKDRFGLVLHNETKVQPVFVMTVLPDGAKLKPSAPPPPDAERDPKKVVAGTWRISHGSLSATRMKMPTLAQNLSGQVERTIVDKTGLTGEYDITLKWTPEDRANAGTDNGAGDAPPAIFEAVKEQLGLKLTADKAPVPTVVVDRIVQPEAD